MGKTSNFESGTLLLNEKAVSYAVMRSTKRKRTIAFKVNAEHGLVIMAPLRTSFKELKKCVQAPGNMRWILKKYAEMEHTLETRQQKKLVTGEHLPYLGGHCSLHVNEIRRSSGACCLKNDALYVTVPSGIPEDERRALVSDKLTAWYRRQAKETVQHRISIWIKASGLQPVKWRITSALRRWGSCSAKNHICINWRLIFAPIELIDYVIVHELCHIAHKDHSRAFWARVGEILPDYQRRKAELKMQVMDFA